MAEAEEKKANPFLQGVASYAKSLPGRLVQMPIRAVQLPFQLAHEMFNTDASQRGEEIEALQRDLNMQVTGQEPAYSEGRRWGNAFSLGLVPNNQAPAVNPAELSPEQAQRFGELTPLQQRLLMSKRPRDFADLLGDDSLFGPEKPKMVQVPGGNRLVNESTGEVVTDVNRPPQVMKPGERLVDPNGGGELYAAPEKPTEEFTKFDPKHYTPESIAKYRKSNDVKDLKVDTTKLDKQLAADLEKARISAASKKDDSGSDLPKMLDVNRVQQPYLSAVKPFTEMADRARTFIGNFGMDPTVVPPDIREDLLNMKLDPGSIQPSAVRDLAMIVGFLKTIDPRSVARESEQAAVAAARELRMPLETVKMVFSGQPLTNDQRVDLFRNMRDAFVLRIAGYDVTREAHKKLSEKFLENVDPDMVVYDVMPDLRDFINGGMSGTAPQAGGGGGLPPEVAAQQEQQFEKAWQDYSSQAGESANEADFQKYLEKLGLLQPE